MTRQEQIEVVIAQLLLTRERAREIADAAWVVRDIAKLIVDLRSGA